jgi:hypothetical protein
MGTAQTDTDATSSRLTVTHLEADTVNVCEREPAMDERDEETKGKGSDAMMILVGAGVGGSNETDCVKDGDAGRE